LLEKVDRILLVAEAVLIALPISILALLTAVMYIRGPFLQPGLLTVNISFGLAILVSLLALFSGWRLFAIFLFRGVKAFLQQAWGWWAILIAGVFVLVSPLLIAKLLSNQPSYSVTTSGAEDFMVFVFALPILVPLCHLTLERLLRKP